MEAIKRITSPRGYSVRIFSTSSNWIIFDISGKESVSYSLTSTLTQCIKREIETKEYASIAGGDDDVCCYREIIMDLPPHVILRFRMTRFDARVQRKKAKNIPGGVAATKKNQDAPPLPMEKLHIDHFDPEDRENACVLIGTMVNLQPMGPPLSVRYEDSTDEMEDCYCIAFSGAEKISGREASYVFKMKMVKEMIFFAKSRTHEGTIRLYMYRKKSIEERKRATLFKRPAEQARNAVKRHRI